MPAPSIPDPSTPRGTSLASLTEEKTGALRPDDSVHTAGPQLRDRDTSRWPVVQDRQLVGMIGQQNPDWHIAGHGHDPKATKVGEIMSDDLMYCYEDEDCASAEELMEECGLSYLPVVDRGMRIIGIFTREEIQAQARAATTGTESNLGS